MRYFDGSLHFESVDVSATAHGRTWRHTRSFANSLGSHAPAFNGFGWCVPIHLEFVLMRRHGGSEMFYALVIDGNRVIWFLHDQAEGEALYPFQDDYLIVAPASGHLPGNITIFMPDGASAVFHGPAADPALRGKLLMRRDPGGLASHYLYNSGRLSSVTQTVGTLSVAFHYLWTEVSQNVWRIENVELHIGGQIEASASYEYDGGYLRRVERWRRSPVTGAMESIGESWYTYHGTGYRGLKFVLEQEALARLRAASIDPATAEDTDLADYADFYFEYDAQGAVLLERVKGGAYTFTFEYFRRSDPGTSSSSPGSDEPSGFPPSTLNIWKFKTIETRPDGTKNIVYANGAGQTMLHVFRAGSSEWATGYRFDDEGGVVRKAEPSAILDYSEADDGLFTLRDNDGLIRNFANTFPTTESDGVVKVSTLTVQQGQIVTLVKRPVKVRELGYALAVSPLGQKYALSRDTVYQTETPDGGETAVTRRLHQWNDTVRPVRTETRWPFVSAAQNGPGLAVGGHENPGSPRRDFRRTRPAHLASR